MRMVLNGKKKILSNEGEWGGKKLLLSLCFHLLCCSPCPFLHSHGLHWAWRVEQVVLRVLGSHGHHLKVSRSLVSVSPMALTIPGLLHQLQRDHSWLPSLTALTHGSAQSVCSSRSDRSDKREFQTREVTVPIWISWSRSDPSPNGRTGGTAPRVCHNPSTQPVLECRFFNELLRCYLLSGKKPASYIHWQRNVQALQSVWECLVSIKRGEICQRIIH